jgi:hypothetical protein
MLKRAEFAIIFLLVFSFAFGISMEYPYLNDYSRNSVLGKHIVYIDSPINTNYFSDDFLNFFLIDRIIKYLNFCK